MYYGGDYNPEQWPAEVWPRDAALRHEVGGFAGGPQWFQRSSSCSETRIGHAAAGRFVEPRHRATWLGGRQSLGGVMLNLNRAPGNQGQGSLKALLALASMWAGVVAYIAATQGHTSVALVAAAVAVTAAIAARGGWNPRN